MSNEISMALNCILCICFVIFMMGRRPIVLNLILSFVICHLIVDFLCRVLSAYITILNPCWLCPHYIEEPR